MCTGHPFRRIDRRAGSRRTAPACPTRRVSSVTVTDVEQIREALSGDDRFSREQPASLVFALAVQSFTSWPVDAWVALRDKQGLLRTLYWIQGNALGHLIAEGDETHLDVTGSVQPISNINAVRIAAAVSQDDYSAGRGRRKVTVEVDGAQDITVDVAQCRGHLRERANEFIDALLAAVSKPVCSTRTR